MIIVDKGNTQSQLICTVSERDNLYPSATGSYFLYIVNDINGTTYSIPNLIDQSPIPDRLNIFVIDETVYNFSTGNHQYTFYTTETSGDELETGRFLVVGSMSVNPVYL